MYASGFKIDTKLFIIGGLGQQGHVLESFKELDYHMKHQEEPIIDKGRQFLEPIYASAITPVFY